MTTVLLPAPMAEDVTRALADRFDLVRLWEQTDPAGWLARYGATVRAVATAGSPVDGALLAALPRLEIVASFGVGYDSIDVQEAARRGIVVTNTPDVLTDDVADVAIGLLLMVVRELPQAERHLRAGRWPDGPYRLTPTRLRDRRLGVLGLGRIGAAIAKRAEVFGLPVAYHNRRPRAVPYRYCASVAELAETVDTLVVAAPGGPATRHLVDADVLGRLGPDGVLVNVARGSVVDEAALVEALRDGTLLGAGLDVYADEPHVPEALRALPNAVLLPHVGSGTVHTRRDMGRSVVDNLTNWFDRGRALTPVPETPQPERRETRRA